MTMRDISRRLDRLDARHPAEAPRALAAAERRALPSQ